MADLISREAAIEAAIDGADDWDGGYSPERERYIREHMAKVSAVDAVPVEWLRERKHWAAIDGDHWAENIISYLLEAWQKEQEAR